MNHSLRWRLCAVAAGFAGTLWLLGAGVAVALAWGTTAGCLAAAAAWLRRTRAMAARVDDAVRDLELALDLGVGSVNRPGAGDPLPILADAAARLRRAAQRGAARTEALARQVADMERRYEETLAMVRGRSGFMANLCHEIRTPLNGLLGFLSMLSETSLDEQQRDWVGIARSSGESLLALLNDVLDLAKIEAGKLSLEQIEFDRDELFENVAGLFAPAAHSRGVELLVDLDQSLPPRLLGDPVRLRQVLANLVGNAVKFTARGEVELAARCTARGGSRAVVEISVTDTGVGIPSDRLERLFLPFEQGDETTARRFGGTGLGLAIVKRIVEQMAGEITVESEVGKGTRVQVLLPLGVPADAPAAPPPASEPALCLVVDGHVRRRELLVKLLRSWQHDVRAAVDATTALAEVQKLAERPEALVVLIDDGVPLSGELLAAIRGRMASRILLMRPPAAAYDAVAEGVDCVLVRPLRRAVLAPAIAGQTKGAGPRAAAGPSWPGRRILLVEDNPVNQRLMCTLLTRLGVDVLLASDGREAVDAFARYQFDMVLMDVQMPNMDGLEATRAIRAMPSGATVPIIALTANAQNGDREACLAAGMTDYLTKPVRAMALREMMARHLRPPAASLASNNK